MSTLLDQDKTREQLLQEMQALRERLAELEEAPVSAARPSAQANDVFGELLESAPDAMVVIDQEGTIVRVNARTEELFGYGRQELLGRKIEVLVPDRLRGDHVRQRTEFMANPRARPLGVGRDLFGRRKDGSEVPVEISLSPWWTPDGLRVISAVRDVSERHRMTERLSQAESKYRTLVEGIPAITFLAPLDGSAGELYVSPQIEEILGFSQEEWVGDPVLWHRQLHPDDQERWNQAFAPTCAEGRPFRDSYRFVARDGRVVWVHGEAKIVRDGQGQPLFLQGVAFDITERMQAEEVLRDHSKQLERQVAERTQALQERAAELERSNKELERFGFFVAHELKAPLITIKDCSQELGKLAHGQLDPEADELVADLLWCSRQMTMQIKMMLQYARVGQESRDKGLVPTECNAVFEGARALLQSMIRESGAEVTAGPLPTDVLADPVELGRLFENLISNAIKYRDPGRPPRVEVRARRVPDGWEFAVADNGKGIKQQHLGRIFELFKTLQPKDQSESTGIGLALCKRIVEYHRGRIWVESEPGQGSTFYFTLPDKPPEEVREEG